MTHQGDNHLDRPLEELDYRFTLANERTFLAWMRTSLAVMAGAVAITQFATSVPRGLRLFSGLVLVVLAVALSAAGFRSWGERERRMRSGEPIARSGLLLAIAAAVSLVGLLVAIVIVVSTE